MSPNSKNAGKSPALRGRAEAKLSAQTGQEVETAGRDPRALLHELQVHQIELEMQNEELHRAIAEAEQMRRRYQDLYDFAPVGYISLDQAGKVLDGNLRAATLLGCVRTSFLNLHLARFFDDESSLEFERFRRRVLAGTQEYRCVAKLKKHSDGDKWLLLEGEALTEGKGTGEAWRVALMDISDRKKAEEEIERLNSSLVNQASELERSNSDLKAFGYTLTHDLRRPLTRINSAGQLLLEICTHADDECPRIVRKIVDWSMEMDNLINAVFSLSHSSFVPIKKKPTDLHRIALDIAAGLQLSALGRKASFVIPSTLSAVCDPALIRLVLDNLLGNAWKFTSERDHTVIEFGTADKGGETAFFIRDNGIGFSAKEEEKMFQPFHRTAAGSVFKGHGIGLATVQRIIERHGGRVWAKGKAGKGATFYFTLPEKPSGA